VTSDRMRGNSLKFTRGGLDWILGKSSPKFCQTLEQAAQGSGGVTIPGDV